MPQSLDAPLAKQFKTHGEQIALLRERGMLIESDSEACRLLEQVNYYRLSGYWYSWRKLLEPGKRADSFIAGTTLDDVAAVYMFDCKLREIVFGCLGPIELSVRSMLGHELGRIDTFAHLRPSILGSLAQASDGEGSSAGYLKWLGRYEKELSASREDFVAHHNKKYGGRLPIWAAVEVMDWGSLTYLYQLAPIGVRDTIAARVDLSAAQFGSWLKALNILRNYSAHHARMFNRVYTIKPRLPRKGRHPELDMIAGVVNRTFGQLTLIQYLLVRLDLGDTTRLPKLLEQYPQAKPLPISHLGMPDNWQENPLWATKTS